MLLQSDRFVPIVTEKLLTYALGRGLERYDAKTVRQIASRLPRHQYKFSGLVLEIVNSLPFTSRRPESTSRSPCWIVAVSGSLRSGAARRRIDLTRATSSRGLNGFVM